MQSKDEAGTTFTSFNLVMLKNVTSENGGSLTWDDLITEGVKHGSLLVRDGRAPERIYLTLGPDKNPDGGFELYGLKLIAQALGLAPLKVATTPLIDWFGTSAWPTMYRRTNRMFREERNLRPDHRGEGDSFSNESETVTEGYGAAPGPVKLLFGVVLEAIDAHERNFPKSGRL